MADAAKAVEVAQDTLKWLRTPAAERKAVVRTGAYLAGRIDPDVGLRASLRDVLPEVRECRVCMLGACLVAKARLFGDVLTGPFLSEYEDDGDSYLSCDFDAVASELEGVFDRETMDALESAFERCNIPEHGYGDAEPSEAHLEVCNGAVAFGWKYPDPTGRAVAVMENVVAHGGRFVVGPMSKADYDKARAAYLESLEVEF